MLILNCKLHNNKWNKFCRKCNEVICDICIIDGPHNTLIHVYSSVEDEYNKRKTILINNKNNVILQKKEWIKNKILILEQRKEKLKDIFNFVKKEINNYYQEMINLTLDDFIKIINPIRVEIGTLESDISFIYNVIYIFNNNLNLNKKEDQINFIYNYKNFKNIISKFLKKEINKLDIKDIVIYDKYKIIKSIILKNENNLKLVKFHDNIIKNLIQRFKNKDFKYELFKLNKNKKYIKKWKLIFKILFMKFNSILYICYFCGRILNKNLLNKECENNKNFNTQRWCNLNS